MMKSDPALHALPRFEHECLHCRIAGMRPVPNAPFQLHGFGANRCRRFVIALQAAIPAGHSRSAGTTASEDPPNAKLSHRLPSCANPVLPLLMTCPPKSGPDDAGEREVF